MGPDSLELVFVALAGGAVPRKRKQAEAVNFVEQLISHLPNRAAAVRALRISCVESAAAADKQKEGQLLSSFLSKRRKFRVTHARVVGNWEEHFTRGNERGPSRRYFYNNATQATTWEVPPEFILLDESAGKLASIGEDEEDCGQSS